MKYILPAILSCVIVCGCKYNANNTIIDNNCEVLTFNDSKDLKRISDITSDRRVLFLESNENSLIGSSLRRVIQHDSLLIIMDDMKQVLVFTTDGRHKYTIHNIGQGPGEYIDLADVAVDAKHNELLLLTYTKLLHYSIIDGSYLGKTTDLNTYYEEIVVKDDIAYLLWSTFINNEVSSYTISTINLATGEKIDYLQPNEDFAPNCYYSGAQLNTIGKDEVIMTRKFDSYIYSLNANSLKTKYDIDWGKYAMHPEKGTIYDCSEIYMITFKSHEIYSLSGLQTGDTIMTFITNVPQFYYAYLQTNEVYKTMFVIDSELPLSMIDLFPVNNSDGWVMATFSYSYIEKLANVMKDNEALQNVFARMNEDSNPLCILYKLK